MLCEIHRRRGAGWRKAAADVLLQCLGQDCEMGLQGKGEQVKYF